MQKPTELWLPGEGLAYARVAPPTAPAKPRPHPPVYARNRAERRAIKYNKRATVHMGRSEDHVIASLIRHDH